MNELIKINFNDERQTTSARSLWEFLGQPYGRFNEWFDQFKGYGFVESVDFRSLAEITVKPQGGRPSADYEITLDMAKELSMLQRSEKGKRAREYFIEVDKQWNSPITIMARAQQIAQRTIESLRQDKTNLALAISKMAPKAQGYDNLMNATGTVTIKEAAAIINIKGVGQNKFFKLLTFEEIIQTVGNSYLPCSEFKDHFAVKQNPIWKGDVLENRSQLYLDMAGLDWLAKFLVKRGYEVNYKRSEALVMQ